jgi:hypothetical protein
MTYPSSDTTTFYHLISNDFILIKSLPEFEIGNFNSNFRYLITTKHCGEFSSGFRQNKFTIVNTLPGGIRKNGWAIQNIQSDEWGNLYTSDDSAKVNIGIGRTIWKCPDWYLKFVSKLPTAQSLYAANGYHWSLVTIDDYHNLREQIWIPANNSQNEKNYNGYSIIESLLLFYKELLNYSDWASYKYVASLGQT